MLVAELTVILFFVPSPLYFLLSVSPWFHIQKAKVDKSSANPSVRVANAAGIQVVIS